MISVILPTHNRAHTLKRALDSVAAQILSPGMPAVELVVVDDGSADSTPDLLAAAAPAFPFSLKVVRTESRGVAAARNLGVTASRGEWLAFLDSDDEWKPPKLARQWEFHRAGRSQGPLPGPPSAGFRIHQTREIWIRHGKRVNPPLHAVKKGGDLFAASLNHCLITPSSVFLERSLFEEMGGFDPSFPACEDYELWLRITARHPVGLLEEDLLIRYGGHADQLSSRFPAMDGFRIRALAKLLETDGLSESRAAAAREALDRKLRIYEGGARKRGRAEEVEFCAAMRARFRIPPLLPA